MDHHTILRVADTLQQYERHAAWQPSRRVRQGAGCTARSLDVVHYLTLLAIAWLLMLLYRVHV
jgi:hypothetical protein